MTDDEREILSKAGSILARINSPSRKAAQRANMNRINAQRVQAPCTCNTEEGKPHRYFCMHYRRDAKRKSRAKKAASIENVGTTAKAVHP